MPNVSQKKHNQIVKLTLSKLLAVYIKTNYTKKINPPPSHSWKTKHIIKQPTNNKKKNKKYIRSELSSTQIRRISVIKMCFIFLFVFFTFWLFCPFWFSFVSFILLIAHYVPNTLFQMIGESFNILTKLVLL